YLPSFVDKPAKHIIKYVHFEPFRFNVVDLKNDINTEIREVENVVLFEYDDKKIFEKSKTHKVEI
ncbi:B12-binding domain-containing radical SAM protein, partial [Clostridioides difficile]|nr:B12-binding domain-containing radical SAM protein [Clostridioides difficile]